MSKRKKHDSETSEKLTGIKLGKAQEVAGGLKAVGIALKHVNNEMPIAKGLKVLNKLNQKKGIDCPGCAWPDPDDERSSLGEYCENGVKAIAEEATAKALYPEFFKQNSIQQLAVLSDFEIGKKGRIAQPMYLKEGNENYEEISWDAAFSLIAQHLNNLADPDEAIFYTSGRTSNEAAFLYQLFVREFGTNNLPDCSNMCHESSGKALGQTLGIGKGSVKLEDFEKAEVIMVMGQNPGTNHPRMLNALKKAKRNGATIISVNPVKEAGLVSFNDPQELKTIIGGKTKLSDYYLQVKLNGDQALLQIINHLLVKQDALDHAFIQNKTIGFEQYQQHISHIDVETLLPICGIPLSEIEKIVALLAKKSKIIVCWAMGLTQHYNAVDTIKEVVNLLLLKGSIAKAGAGTCPVRGHSNVQGDRTVGIVERPPKALADNIRKNFGFEVPEKHGYDVVNSIKAMYEGKAKVFFAMGGNFLSATPDTLYTAKALEQCTLTVHVSTKLNRSHLVHGKEALILPCLGRTDQDVVNGKDQFVTVENSMGFVHSSQGVLPPFSDKLLSEPAIVCRLAKATIPDSKVNWDKYLESYDHIRDEIEHNIKGFDNYNKRVSAENGFYLPNVARSGNFIDGKAYFTAAHCEALNVNDEDFVMMTLRSHDQFNTTIYGLDDRYRGIYNERRVILMNKKDMQRLNLKAQDKVNIYNDHGGIERLAPNFVVVPYDIPVGCVGTYFPEANVLVPIDATALQSNTPTSKSVIVRVVVVEESE